jgi:hypothetical protein
MEIVSALCIEKCSEYAWVDEHGYMSVKGKTKERFLPIDDLIRQALAPYGWDVWIPLEDYFNGYDFRIGIKQKEPESGKLE